MVWRIGLFVLDVLTRCHALGHDGLSNVFDDLPIYLDPIDDLDDLFFVVHTVTN